MGNIAAEIVESDLDRRGAPRRKVLKFVQIVFPDKASVLDCCLKSLSPSGALIGGQSMVDVPDRFYIRTPAHPTLVPCAVVRRALTSLAVRFEADPGKLIEGG